MFVCVAERDFICNYLGINAWTLDLAWRGQEAFRRQALIPWYHPATTSKTASPAEAGRHRTYGNLTFLTVHDSSHFVPYSQPQAALKMFNAWIHDQTPPQ